jgi:hypothetical protein
MFIYTSAPGESKKRHFVGLPPALTGGTDTRVPLPRAVIVILEKRQDGFFLLRYAEDGAFAGDTWHMNEEDALHQARCEFGDSAERWIIIPDEVVDPLNYVRKWAKRSSG